QPVAVEIDTDVLSTLPPREVSSGLAEVISYGMILVAEFLDWCAAIAESLRAPGQAALSSSIAPSGHLKPQVVARSERESGERALLTFGHTFGHAIEAGMGYGAWLHGEAVGCGMVQAAELSARVHGLPQADVDRIRALVQAIGCPVLAPDLGAERWLDL